MRGLLRYGGIVAAGAAFSLALPSTGVASGGSRSLAGGRIASGGAGLPVLGAAATGLPALGTPATGGAILPPTGAATPATAASPPASGTPVPAPPGRGMSGRWIAGFAITEYWAAPESWFRGALVSAPGLPGRHRIDWLYSAEGISMNGEGIGLDGRMYHLAAAGAGGWVTAAGRPTDAAKGWNGGAPAWRSGGYWRNRTGGVTFPLEAGGWSHGPGQRYVPLPGVSFAPGPSLPLRPYQSIAVDPRVIPFGSLVYIPAYRRDGHGGWFVAQDTGGAIVGHRIDVYRTPPASPADGGQYLTAQRVFVASARAAATRR